MSTLSNSGFSFLKGEEGYRNYPYRLKGEKYYTVGLGHNGPDVIPGKNYSDEEIQALFKKDELRFTQDVMKIWDNTMTQNMFDAMFSFAYNHGNISQTALGQAIKNGGWKDKDRITQIWRTSYCSGQYATVLKQRRLREVSLFYSGSEVGNMLYGSNFGTGYHDWTSGNDYGSTEGQNVYSSPGENISSFSSDITTTLDNSNDNKHTRIYKANDPTIVLDELSIPMDVKKLEDEEENA